MSELDAALALTQPEPVTSVSTTTVRRCRRHQWRTVHRMTRDIGGPAERFYHVHLEGFPCEATDCYASTQCARCYTFRDDTLSRRGRQSRRLGGDQERRAEKRYGWTKIGERGEKTDLRGRFAKVQQKSTRKPPPALFRDTFAGLDATKDGRVPLLLLTYVQQGRPTEDYVILRGEDWLALHGKDGPCVSGVLGQGEEDR